MDPHQTIGIRAFVTACIVLPICGAIAFAQTDATFDGMLSRLDSADWYERQDATDALIASDSVSMDMIEAALRSKDLSAEQRDRLDLISLQRYRREPLAGLGVQFGSQGRGAVTISAVVPEFPASELLRSGDVILSVGSELSGGLIGGQDDLRAEILSRRPGEIMPVLIRRGKETLELDLPLGSYANLQGAAMLDDETVRTAMQRRRSRERGPVGSDEAVIGSGLDLFAWVAGAFPQGTWQGLEGDGERRDAMIVPGGPDGSLSSRARRSMLRTFWSGMEEALQEAAQQMKDRAGRQMTDAVVLRGMYVEHELSLLNQIDTAREEGRETDTLESMLDRLREQLAKLDARLAQDARRIDETIERAETIGQETDDPNTD